MSITQPGKFGYSCWWLHILITLSAQTDANVIEDPDESIPAQIPDIVSEQQNEVNSFKILCFLIVNIISCTLVMR